MARLVIHVGTHKTATTTIQKTFHANRKLLAKHGIHYPNMGRVPGHHGLVTDWVNLPPVFHLPEGSAAAWQRLVRETAKGDQTVFLSSEEFSRGHPDNRIDLAKIRSWLDPFEEVRVICTLRDQVSFLQSVYLEISKKKAPMMWATYLSNAIKRGYAAGLLLDYTQLDDHLLTAFSEHEIEYLDYSTACEGPGILATVLDKAGCEMDPALLANGKNVPSANVSPDPLSAWIAGMIVRPNVPSTEMIAFVNEKLLSALKGPSDTTIFTRSEQKRVEAVVEPKNAALHQRLAARQPNFRLSPTSFPKGIAYRNDLPTGFWLNLSKSLYKGDAPDAA
ncbi:MAG: hypothetical protein AAFM92_12950 [Pseudomonadota bacterium]